MEDPAGLRTIYFVWGSTFFAIRVGVSEVPPFLFCAMRFLAAGLLVYGWAIARGERAPNARQWISVFLLAFLIFAVDSGLLFLAETARAFGHCGGDSGNIPAFMALAEIVILRTQRLTFRLAAALVAGIAGVAILMIRSAYLERLGSLGRLGKLAAPIDTAGAVALVIGALSWSVASALSRKLALPASKVMSLGAQMLAGGILLAMVAAVRGELRDFISRICPTRRGSHCFT